LQRLRYVRTCRLGLPRMRRPPRDRRRNGLRVSRLRTGVRLGGRVPHLTAAVGAGARWPTRRAGPRSRRVCAPRGRRAPAPGRRAGGRRRGRAAVPTAGPARGTTAR